MTQVTPRRGGIPKAVRDAVIARDGLACRRCGIAVKRAAQGEAYSPDQLHLDHAIPWAEGGGHTVENLIVSCAQCNLTRSTPRRTGRRISVGWRQDGTDYYWTDPRYRPPRRLTNNHPYLFTVAEAAQILEQAPEHILAEVVLGRMGGTTGASKPVRIDFPRSLDGYVAYRMDMLGLE